jgi:branched-chain amino acid aminotransferase
MKNKGMKDLLFQQALSNLKNFQPPETIQFGKTLVPAMVRSIFKNKEWTPLELIPYGPLQIDPAAKVLHYAQEIFEGLKSYKNPSGDIFLFRPYDNAQRFNYSANKMAMPELPEDFFIESLRLLVSNCQQFHTTHLADAFYLRPFMFGDEPQLGVRPSTSYQYYVIGGPAGNYFTNASVKVRVETKSHRASSKGIGRAKTGGNYAASMKAGLETTAIAYDQTLWLDPIHDRFVEEFSGMNFFAVIDNVLTTPLVNNSILKGITRDSILKLADFLKIPHQEKSIDIFELMDAIDNGRCQEIFACGTASVLTPVECLNLDNRVASLKKPQGEISLVLKKTLQEIQTGRREDPFGWRLQLN